MAVIGEGDDHWIIGALFAAAMLVGFFGFGYVAYKAIELNATRPEAPASALASD